MPDLKAILCGGVLVMVLSLATTAQAAMLTFIYEGVIDQTQGGSAFDDFLGRILRFEYTFFDTTMGNVDQSAGDPNLGQFATTTLTMTIVGGDSYSGGGGTTDILIQNDIAGNDLYQVSGGVTGPPIGGVSGLEADLRLFDNTGTAFSSKDLPLIPPNPSAFSETQLSLTFEDGFG